jgi:hypothetical protein
MVTVGLRLCTVMLWTPYLARKPGEVRPSSGVQAPLRRDLSQEGHGFIAAGELSLRRAYNCPVSISFEPAILRQARGRGR